jgi:DNA-binding response OmpR family regulator
MLNKLLAVRFSSFFHGDLRATTRVAPDRPAASLSLTSPTIAASEISALLIGPDGEMSAMFSHMFEEIGIRAESCSDDERVPGILSNSKFEALVLDFDNVEAGVSIICKLRESSSSKDAIVFAVATASSTRQRALAGGANFAFGRPFVVPEIRNVLQTAYALMLRDRRRYFRCPAEYAVHITRTSGQTVQGMTINVSSNGMATNLPCNLQFGERLNLSFAMSDAELTINAVGRVVWDDKHGKTGISFECTSAEVGKQLAAWLEPNSTVVSSRLK